MEESEDKPRKVYQYFASDAYDDLCYIVTPFAEDNARKRVQTL